MRRRNPPAITVQGITRTLMQGAQDALIVVGGEMGANLIANQIPPIMKDASGVETQAGLLVRRALSAVAVGIAAGMIFRGDNAMVRKAVAGALSAPIKSLLRPVLPTTGPFAGLLAGPRMRLSAYPLASYPRALPGLSSYPRTGLAQVPYYGYNYGA